MSRWPRSTSRHGVAEATTAAVAIVLMVLLLASDAPASITLPLQGYCRPGRYFPIQIDGDDSAAALTFSADGCLPTQIQPATSTRRIVAMLASGFSMRSQIKVGVTFSADAKKVTSTFNPITFNPISLRMPGVDERLVASTAADVSPAIPLFPGKRLLPIHLDPADPLPGPPAAWETLDAVLLDADAFSRISDAQRSALLAGGTMLICTGESPPDARWPWVRRNELWVLAHEPAGPVADVVNEDAYAPTYAWAPGWSSTIRAQVMGVATLLVIVILALLLRPNRWTFGSAILLPILATIGISAWRASLGTITRAGGDIVIAQDGLIQHDAWVYERARESSTQTVNWSNWTHPVFASDAAIGDSQLKLIVTPAGDLQFSYMAAAGHTMAFVRREVLPGTTPTASMPANSPMSELARSAYLKHGDQITGQTPPQPGRWPTVVITGAPR